MPFPFVPVIMGAVAIANAIISAKSSKKQMQRTNAANLELAKYGYDQQQQQIDKQNVYNSPQAQMQRFASAGLNPNLIYSQGSSGNQASIPEFDAPRQDMHYKNFQIPEVLSEFQNYRAMETNIDSSRANAARARADTQKSAAEIQLINSKVRTEAVDRMNKLLGHETGRFDLELAKELRKHNIDIRKHEATQAGIKAATLAQELELLETFGAKEKTSRLATEAVNQARAIASTATEKERLSLMQTFGWTKGYQESALMENRILNEHEQMLYNQLKTKLFREHEITPSDNIFLRLLVHWMKSTGHTAEDIPLPR